MSSGQRRLLPDIRTTHAGASQLCASTCEGTSHLIDAGTSDARALRSVEMTDGIVRERGVGGIWMGCQNRDMIVGLGSGTTLTALKETWPLHFSLFGRRLVGLFKANFHIDQTFPHRTSLIH